MKILAFNFRFWAFHRPFGLRRALRCNLFAMQKGYPLQSLTHSYKVFAHGAEYLLMTAWEASLPKQADKYSIAEGEKVLGKIAARRDHVIILNVYYRF